MPVSDQIAAYDDCFVVFDKALADPEGLRVRFRTKGEAGRFQIRLCKARKLERDQSKRIYERSDVRWGKSRFDKLAVRSPVEDSDGFWWVYIDRHGSEILGMEPLSEMEAPDEEGVVSQSH